MQSSKPQISSGGLYARGNPHDVRPITGYYRFLLMHRELFVTADGSHSLRAPELNVSYHSKHGAISESLHIFINSGFNYIPTKKGKVAVLEMGFGTGLNAFLTMLEAEKNGSQVFYDAVELYPVEMTEAVSFNYSHELNIPEKQMAFLSLHSSAWNVPVKISDHFVLTKLKGDIKSVRLPSSYDVVYFDAFDPVAQPELWTREIFSKIYSVMNEGGVMVTFCSKSVVRKAMTDAGFRVEKLKGPAGKREIVRAGKN